MSDPKRLIVSADTTDLEKDLLASWADERPSAASRQKTLAALGVAASVTAAGTATASVTPKAAAAGWTVLTKWLAASAVAVGATVAGIGIATHVRSAPKEITPPATAAPTRVVETKAPVETIETAPPATIELTEPVHPAPQTTKVAPPAASTLAQQVAALDRARGALDTNDTGRARKLVDTYEAEYPAGAFTQEAEVVRVDALVREGNRAEAERAGKRFLSAYPKSPHAARVRALLGYDR